MTRVGLLEDDYVVALQDPLQYSAEGFLVNYKRGGQVFMVDKSTSPRPTSQLWTQADWPDDAFSYIDFGANIVNRASVADDINWTMHHNAQVGKVTSYFNSADWSQPSTGAVLRYWRSGTKTVLSTETLRIFQKKLTVRAATSVHYSEDVSTATTFAASFTDTVGSLSTNGTLYTVDEPYELKVYIGTGEPNWNNIQSWVADYNPTFNWDLSKTVPIQFASGATSPSDAWDDFMTLMDDDGYTTTNINAEIDADGYWSPSADTDFDWMLIIMPRFECGDVNTHLVDITGTSYAEGTINTPGTDALVRKVGQSSYSNRLSNLFCTGTGTEFPDDFIT